MVIGQPERHSPPEHRTHRAVPAVPQLSEEDDLLRLPVLEELPEGVKRTMLSQSELSTAEHKTSASWFTYSLRYLQIIPATFSQFFLVGQNTRQECVGMTSVTRAMM